MKKEITPTASPAGKHQGNPKLQEYASFFNSSDKITNQGSTHKKEDFFSGEIPGNPFFPGKQYLQSSPIVQSKAAGNHTSNYSANSKTTSENSSGIPGSLKSGLEQLSGEDLSDVKIHQDSYKPSRFNALAYAQGKDIYLGPGQEKHLPHEGWHVVQQMKGKVQPTSMVEGIPVNTENYLEQEADEMGAKAVQMKQAITPTSGGEGFTPGKYSLAENLSNLLSPVTSPGHVAQFTLNTDLQGLLGIYGPVHYEGVINAIRAAPVAERQVAVADNTILNLIKTRLNPTYGSEVVSELLVGSQNWANPPATDFYTYFVLNGGTGPIPTDKTMNCWESILYAAYLSGQVSAAWIRNYYVSAGALPGTTVDPTPRLWAQLGFTTTLPTYDPNAGHIPAVGQLVFYVSAGSPIPGHVAVYIGNGEVISLWTRPNNINSVQRISITAISGTIYYGNTPW